MAVITLSREMGSRGDDVARADGSAAGATAGRPRSYDRAAKEIGAPEIALAEIDELGLLGVKPRRQPCGSTEKRWPRLSTSWPRRKTCCW